MMNKGFTLFVAIVTMGTILLVSAGMVSLAVRHYAVASSGNESQHAFYAADTGIECAIYWDIADPSGESAFATSTTSNIQCNGQAINGMGGAYTSEFNLNFSPDPYCAIVTVAKGVGGGTIIESKGYNTCDTSNPRRVERAVRASY